MGPVHPTPMRGARAYVDESVRRQLIMGVVVVAPNASREVDRLVRGLLMPGQRQLHMTNESDSRRRRILDEIARSEKLEAWVYCAPRPLVSARERCISAMVTDLVKAGVESLTLDRVDSGQARRDRVAITRTLSTVATDISYGHAPAWDAAGVQLADAVAWAYGAGGHWRQRLQPILRGNHVDV